MLPFTPPEFWFRPLRGPARALVPLARLYAHLQARHQRHQQAGQIRLDVPVISVGNLVVGGAGKTPVCAFLAHTLQQAGAVPHILTRGYGRQNPGASGGFRVDPARHTVQDAGEEALLLARHAPVWVGASRACTGQQAVQAGATALVLDDAHQHHTLYKSCSVVVVNQDQGTGNGQTLPAGPLREPVAEGMARADLLWWMGHDASSLPPPKLAAGKPVVRAFLTLPSDQQALLAEGVWVAFAGLGFPRGFFSFLQRQGARLVHTFPLPDHATPSPAVQQHLLDQARKAGARLVTTEKDAIKWPRALCPHLTVVQPVMQVVDLAPFHAVWARA